MFIKPYYMFTNNVDAQLLTSYRFSGKETVSIVNDWGNGWARYSITTDPNKWITPARENDTRGLFTAGLFSFQDTGSSPSTTRMLSLRNSYIMLVIETSICPDTKSVQEYIANQEIVYYRF